MNPAVAAPPIARSTSSTLPLGWLPAAALLILIWGEVIAQLRPEWTTNPQYGYGWSVPFLVVYLVWKLWPDRPSRQRTSPIVPLVLLTVAAFAFAAVRFVAEANSDWRLLSWALALIAVTMSLTVAYLVGGRPWLRYFAFPALFFLVAVPWPVLFEQAVIQNLMRAVSAINVGVLNLAGIPALRHGNLIEVSTGLIGVEEACSGVRSLQATLMISLFLGEFYSFGWVRRVVLIAAGAVLAFLCNVVRTTILVWIGAERGPNAIASWHDPAGLTILLICLFGLWFLSMAMGRGLPNASSSSVAAASGPPVGAAPVFCAVAAIGMIGAEAFVQYWYAAHRTAFETVRWSVNWPTNEPAYKSIPIAPEAEALLHYNDGGGGSWRGADDHEWLMYFFRWLPGQTAARFVKIHRPDICLPASGRTLLTDSGIGLIEVNGVKLPVRSYRFDDSGRPLHVFYCYWDARSSYENAATAAEEDWSPRGRIRSAVRGQRDRGAQMLELAVWGYDDDAAANEALRRELAAVVGRS